MKGHDDLSINFTPPVGDSFWDEYTPPMTGHFNCNGDYLWFNKKGELVGKTLRDSIFNTLDREDMLGPSDKA